MLKKYITCKIFFLLVYIFSMWEFDAENHLLNIKCFSSLKMSRDFVVKDKAQVKAKLKFFKTFDSVDNF